MSKGGVEMRSDTIKICEIFDEEIVHTYADKPTAACGICGAKAREPSNLCDPLSLPTVGMVGE